MSDATREEAPTAEHQGAGPQGPPAPHPVGIVITPLMLWGGASLLAAVAGSLGTWVSLGSLDVSGIRGDGLISLIAAVIGIVALALPRFKVGVEIVVAAVVLGLSAYELARILSFDGGGIFSVSVGWGLVLLTVAGVSHAFWCGVQISSLRDRGIFAAVLIGLAIALAVIGAQSSDSDSPPVDDSTTSLSGDANGDTDTDTTVADDVPDTASATSTATTPSSIGVGIRLTGSNGLTMRATVTDLIDPLDGGDYDEPSSGKRFVGVELTLSNVGNTTYDDSPSNGATLIYGDDREATSGYVSGGPCEGLSFSGTKIAPGARRKGCLVFEVPRQNTAKLFQFTLDSGFADLTGEWNLRPASAPSSSTTRASVASPASSSASSSGSRSTKKCDQNISAGTDTSCSFADSVFASYAAEIQDGGAANTSVDAYSEALGVDLTMDCAYDGSRVRCEGGDGAYVAFPKWAADVY